MEKIIIRNLEANDYKLVRHFSCGEHLMDSYLTKESYPSHLLGEGITKLVIKEGHIVAYYTLKCSAIPIKDEEMYEDIRYIPCIELSRLAVSIELQRNGFGTSLLGYIINEIRVISEEIGCYAITLFTSNKYVKWYKKDFDFVIWNPEQSPDEDGLTFMYLKLCDNAKLEELREYQKK